MTLGEFFSHCSQSPETLITYFTVLPLTAFLAWIFGKNEGHLSPWKYLYSILVYLVCIPGIFAVTLSIYMFFFERGSILNANIYTQILPIICMVVTLWLIRRNVDFQYVPGFDKIGSLVFFLTVLIILLWILEKTNIFVFTYMPFFQFALLFGLIIVLLRFGLKRIFG
ncbi:MAG: hypothetical protein IPN29_17860 [Saprospiraceae bacterium]|nr:hypothetical protein [Saprospiraceae bacterium]